MSTVANSHEILYPSRAPAALPGPMMDHGASAGATIGPADVWRIVKQRKLLIALSFIVLYLLVVGATIAVYIWAPSYQSEALIEIRPQRENPYESESNVAPDILKQQLETEARKLTQLGLLQEVLQQPEIKVTEFYKWYGGNFSKCLYDLQKMVRSTPIPDTMLIRVSLAVKSADEAMLIVKTLTRRYEQRYSSDSNDRDRSHLEGLKATLAKINEDIRAKQGEINAFRTSSDVPTLKTERSVNTENVANVTADLSKLDAEAADTQAQLATIQGLRYQELPITAEMKLIVENDPILRFYRQQVEALDVEIAASAHVLGEQHRQVQLLKTRRDGYYQMEASKRADMIDDLRKRYKENLDQNLARIKSIQTQLQEQLADAEAKQRDLDRDLERYQAMEKDEESMRKIRDEIESKVRGAEHQLESNRDAKNLRVSIAQPAEKAVEPSRPDFVLYLGGGFIFALLGAVGLAFLRELSDTAIRTPIDVVRHGHLPVLGTIPQLDDEEADVDAIEVATRRAPHSLVAESFRQVKTTLQYSGPADSQRTILITSARPEDGKTAVAVNLAVTLARSNLRVLLIDSNFRRPAVRASFQNTRAEGLSNLLIGEMKLADVVTKTETPNLDIVSSGRMPPSPAELLGSPLMRELLAEALTRYDRVIIDGPPVLLVSDALVIATQVDAVILVTRAVSNSKGALKRAREQLERVGARVVGAILNGVQARPGGYFKQQYREFYDYTSDENATYELPGLPGEEPTDKDDDAHDADNDEDNDDDTHTSDKR